MDESDTVTVPNVAVATFTLIMFEAPFVIVTAVVAKLVPACGATVTTVEEREVVTVPSVAVATFTLNPATALLTVTSVDVRATLTGFATALVIVEAVVEGVTVPLIVTVPSVAVATFTLKPAALF